MAPGFLLASLVAAQGAGRPESVAAKLRPIPPCPALVAAARTNSIPIEGLSASSSTNALQPGDSATVLATFVQKKKRIQWLLFLEAATRDPAAITNKPASFTVTTEFGPPIQFKSRPYPVRLRMMGPFDAAVPARAPKWKETVAQFSVNEDFLALGMDQAAALLHQWSRSTNFTGAMNSKALKAMNPTPEEQRALCAVFPALISYFKIVEHTEGLEDLLRRLVDLPSIWSMIWNRGVKMNLTFDGVPFPAESVRWNLDPSTPAYHFPWMIQLNDEPALKLTLVTSRPQPPLLIGGGVVGLLAEKIGDEETYMTLRLISARSGPVTGRASIPNATPSMVSP